MRLLLDSGTTVPLGSFPDSELYVWIYCYNVFSVMLMHMFVHSWSKINLSVCLYLTTVLLLLILSSHTIMQNVQFDGKWVLYFYYEVNVFSYVNLLIVCCSETLRNV